jgi:hypothetical protein
LALAPASVDARLTRIHALAAFGSMGDNERLAQATHELRGLREDAARHRRLTSAMAAVAIARRDYKQATVALPRHWPSRRTKRSGRRCWIHWRECFCAPGICARRCACS